MGSNASFNSVPQNAINSCSVEDKRRSSLLLTPPPPIQHVQHGRPKNEHRKLSSISYTKYQEAFGQPLFITPPELVAHLEKAQKESVRLSLEKIGSLGKAPGSLPGYKKAHKRLGSLKTCKPNFTPYYGQFMIFMYAILLYGQAVYDIHATIYYHRSLRLHFLVFCGRQPDSRKTIDWKIV